MKAAIVATAWRLPGEPIANPLSASYALARVRKIRETPARSRNERFLRRMGLYGMEVAREAFAAAGLPAGPRYGLFTAVGGLRAHWDDMLGALANQDASGERAWARGLANVHPYWMLRHLSNNVHALASAELALRGDGATFGGEHAGAHALRSAIRALHDGAIDSALVVAYDSLLEPETLVELGERMPADFVPGEAAAAVVLVREHSPQALGTVDLTCAAGDPQLGAAAAVVDAIARTREGAPA